MSNFSENKGLTLVETIAAIVLIALIFIGFYTFFISSQKIGVASEEIVDATFIAQESIEEVYNLSTSKNINEIIDYYEENKSSVYSGNNTNFKITYNHTLNNVSIELIFIKKTGTLASLYSVQVSVYEKNTLKATLENIFSLQEWGILRNEKGLTLLEVICVISIFTIISLLLFSIVNTSQAQHTTQYKNSQKLTQTSLILKQITNDFRETTSIQKNNNEFTFIKYNSITTIYRYDSSTKTLYRNNLSLATDITSFIMESSTDLKSFNISIENRHGEKLSTTLYIRGE